jgi:hypothetical protein
MTQGVSTSLWCGRMVRCAVISVGIKSGRMILLATLAWIQECGVVDVTNG